MLRPGLTDDLSGAAQSCLQTATQLAARREAGTVEPADLLVAVLQAGGPPAAAVQELGTSPAALIEATGRAVAAAPRSDGAPPAALQEVLVDAAREATVLGHRQTEPMHLLIALSYRTSGLAAAVLADAGVTLFDLRLYVQRHAPAAAAPGPAPPRPRRSSGGRRMRLSPVVLVPLSASVAGGVGLWLGVSPALRWPAMLLFVLGGWIVSVCVHEFCHALVAYLGGDRAIAETGYLSMNPLRYANAAFSLIIPLVFILLGGIGFPGAAVYFDPRALRSRAWQSAVAIAGPVGTLLCLGAVSLPFLLGVWGDWTNPANGYFWAGLALLAFLQLTMLVFNLLPVPPLDGWAAISPYLSEQARVMGARFGMVTILFLFLLLWVPAVNTVFFGLLFQAADLLKVPSVLIMAGLGTLRPF
jgi:Zn-dependent protease